LKTRNAEAHFIAHLEKTQARWQDYMESECYMHGLMTQSGGSWPSTYAVECQARLLEKRYKRMRDAAACVERSPAEKYLSYESVNCLYQILPLNFKGQ
jgi:uncharacterized protein YecT (DUF1311 family)